MDNTHEWCAADVSPQITHLQNLPVSVFTWWMQRLSNNEIIHIEDVALLPAEAYSEREILEHQGVCSLLVLPLLMRNELVGFIGFDDVKETGDWNSEDIEVLRIVTEIIGGTIDRDRAEKSLLTSEQRYRDLYENAPIAYFSLTADGIITDCNLAAALLLESDKSELLGESLWEMLSNSWENKTPSWEFWKCCEPEVVSNYIRDKEIQFRSKRGSRKHIHLHVKIMHDEQGQITQLLAVMDDMTELKLLQANLIQAERMASVGLLAAGVMHEINNPLSYIMFNLQNVAEELQVLAMYSSQISPSGSQNNAALSKFFEKIANPAYISELCSCVADALEGTYQIQNIAKDLKIFSRHDEQHISSISVNRVLDSAIKMSFSQIKNKAKLTKIYDELPEIQVNEGKLAQVFLNLLINAAHAIDEDNFENNQICVRTWSTEDKIYAEISDTGRGISPENLEQIFEPFFSTKELGVGSGLGLFISRSIVNALGGNITVQSKINGGSTFTVCLPLHNEM
jgi:PAS domain S-box-containing protein